MEVYMNYCITIFENEDYIFKLLKFRLSSLLPNSYIYRGIMDLTSTSYQFSDTIQVFFNPLQYSYSEICSYTKDIKCNVNIFSLFNDDSSYSQVIDCTYLYECIIKNDCNDNEQTECTSKTKKAKTTLLIPFSYIDEREYFIMNELKGLTNDLMCLRLDLMAGIRMPTTFSGVFSGTIGLTDLLILASQSEISGSDILAYCIPDNKGFISPGKPKHSDDVFEYGIQAINNLIVAATELNNDTSYPMNVLIVAEGFRMSELIQISSHADEVIFLLPERLHKNDLGFNEEISSIIRAIDSNIPVSIKYVEKQEMDKYYETMQI